MSAPTAPPPAVRIDVHVPPDALAESLVADVRDGLAEAPRQLPPKYFYDEAGCRLFEQITTLPEYYQTRSELQILRREAPGVMERHGPRELVELGSGSSLKARVLLDAMRERGTLERYVPFDVAPGALRESAAEIVAAYPGTAVHGVAGDFDLHLDRIPECARGPRLVAFLGGTIGNLAPERRTGFLEQVAALLGPDDRLLLGTDLAGDPGRLVPAYNDAAEVTAAFNLNVLRVLNRELGADFRVDGFAHVAVYDEDAERIEMRLRARGEQRVTIPAAQMSIAIADGEEILTELSCKFTRSSVESMLAAAGLDLLEWHLDDQERFAVSVAAPS